MPKRQSRRQSRAQKRRRHSQKGGRGEEPVKDEGFLGGLFGSKDEEKKEDAPKVVPAADAPAALPADTPAPKEEVKEEEKKEEGGMFSGLMGNKPDAAPAEAGEKKPKGKKKRHGKYYTNKQLKVACKRFSSKKRNRRNKGKFANYMPTPMTMNAANQNSPYSFGERPVM
jgi:hypothetical protein